MTLSLDFIDRVAPEHSAAHDGPFLDSEISTVSDDDAIDCWRCTLLKVASKERESIAQHFECMEGFQKLGEAIADGIRTVGQEVN